METKDEKLEEIKWEDVSSSNRYAEFEIGKPYQIMVNSARPFRDARFLDSEGRPKIRVKVEIYKMNGKPCDLEWNTGSWRVISELKKAIADGSLRRSTFLVKLKSEGGKTSYLFEKVGEIPSQPQSPSNLVKVESFL